MGGVGGCVGEGGLCLCACSFLIRFSSFGYLLLIIEVRLQANLGYRCKGFFHMLMRSKVKHQGRRSSEVKLGGKCWV